MRADRLLSIIMLLQRRGKVTASALAKELEVSRRTILRDVEALSMAGIPIYADGGHGGGIALDENYRTTLTGLKETELHTLFIGSNQPLLNGWITLQFQIESEVLARMLVFGLGAACEVIAPDTLRAAVKAGCQSLLAVL